MRRTRPSSRSAAALVVSIPKSMGTIVPRPFETAAGGLLRDRESRMSSRSCDQSARGLAPRSSSMLVIVSTSVVWLLMIDDASVSTALLPELSRAASAMGTPAL